MVNPKTPMMMRKRPPKKNIEPFTFDLLTKNEKVPQVPINIHIPPRKEI